MKRIEKNIYHRKDGRWEARFIKGRDAQGKALYGAVYAQTYEEIKQKQNELLKPKTTLDQALERWLQEARKRMKESSFAKYYYIVHHYLKPGLGHYMISDISGAVLNGFAARLIQGENGGVSKLTLKMALNIVNAVLAAEQSAGKADMNALLPIEETRSINMVTKEEQSLFEHFLKERIDETKLGILLCLHTGLQLGEICALKWGDITFEDEKAVITVQRSMQRVTALASEHTSKTKVIEMNHLPPLLRTIPITGELVATLMAFNKHQADAYVLTGTSQKCIEPRTFEYRLKSYVKCCGLKPLNFRSLRYAFVARNIEAGVDLMTLGELMGHANVNTTLDFIKKCNAILPQAHLRVRGYTATIDDAEMKKSEPAS